MDGADLLPNRNAYDEESAKLFGLQFAVLMVVSTNSPPGSKSVCGSEWSGERSNRSDHLKHSDAVLLLFVT